MQAFKINDEFNVSPLNNLLSNTVKLEPRLMKLLCLLVGNRGKLVTREEIVAKIWNGYGGGDEGLTQAISFLRKALNDTNKEIIETVAKGGYIFRGNVELLNEPAAPPSAVKGYLSFKLAGFAAGILILIFALVVYLFFLNRNDTPQPDRIAPKAQPENHASKV
jgi:DNA-binding winged helix-turn-helix (wHTH) protein